MKNIINTKPDRDLSGKNLYSTQFIEDVDVENKKILDIGCGYGWFELYALDKKCKKITGIEITPQDLSTAINSINDPRVEFVVADALSLPFEDGVFDTIVSWEVLEHLPKNSEQKYFSEVKRVLKKDGVFYFSTPKDFIIAKLSDPAWWLMGHRHYNVNNLSNIIEKGGLSIEKSEIRGGIWEIIGALNLYIAKWIFRRDVFFKKNFQDLQNKEFKKPGFTNIFMKLRKLDL